MPPAGGREQPAGAAEEDCDDEAIAQVIASSGAGPQMRRTGVPQKRATLPTAAALGSGRGFIASGAVRSG